MAEMKTQSRLRTRLAAATAYAVIALALVFTIFPIYWIALNSFKTSLDIFAVPPVWFDFQPTGKHYFAAFVERPFLVFALNSLAIAVGTTVFSMVFGTMAGYALARFTYWRNVKFHLSFWILSTRMMPPIVTIIPLFIFFGVLDLLNTKTAVIVAYTAFNLPFVIWMMKSYFQELPVELEEAAIVDGDTRWGAFIRIAVPLARPGLAATSISPAERAEGRDQPDPCLERDAARTHSDRDAAVGDPPHRHCGSGDPVHDPLGRDQRGGIHGEHSDRNLRLHRAAPPGPGSLVWRGKGVN